MVGQIAGGGRTEKPLLTAGAPLSLLPSLLPYSLGLVLCGIVSGPRGSNRRLQCPEKPLLTAGNRFHLQSLMPSLLLLSLHLLLQLR